MKTAQLNILMVMAVLCFSPTQHAQADAHQHHTAHAGNSGHDHTRPDSHAPIGVMGDHLMREGEIMLSYRYMSMEMDGNRIDQDSVDVPLAGYMVSPLSMDMDMHMLGAMYAPSDKITLMLMLPYVSKSMDHMVNMGGARFTTETSGIGDVKLSSTYGLYANPGADFLFNLAVSAPTGSIDEKDITTGTTGVHLPYPMQLGSGTWDFTPGLTYVQTFDDWSWGAQGTYTFRTGENDNGYTLGNKVDVTAWMAKQLSKSASVSFRLEAMDWGNIDGADNKLQIPVSMVPTADPKLRAGTRVDALIGINVVPRGLTSLRLAAEVGVPIYQKLDGPQLETDMVFVLGAQYTF
ncbi:MAG: transporter [Gammaproteobacteria bacterium]|nr:transporter [Gammaproteobacteria bacterium]